MVDVALIKVSAGNGGDGSSSFRREKYIPKGGPDGGDGGDGGSVYLKANFNSRTLDNFASRQRFAANSGEPGQRRNATGAKADDLYLSVPIGTSVYELKADVDNPSPHKAFKMLRELKHSNLQQTSLSTSKHEYSLRLLGEVIEKEDIVLVVKGGRGGRGNTAFKSSTNQTPTPEAGEPGQVRWLILELKLLADIGLIGLPNAGKSTLLSTITAAQPKIGDYAFTTLEPNLGVLKLSNRVSKDQSSKNADSLLPLDFDTELIIADIPGLIEGASRGRGLGDEFLRHVERCQVLVHLVAPRYELLGDPEGLVNTLWKDYQVIRQELADYSPSLVEKSEILVINKVDLIDESLQVTITQEFANHGLPQPLYISAASKIGIPQLLKELTNRAAKE